MTNTTLMDVLDPTNKLLVDSDGCLLMKSLVLYYVLKELSVNAVLHDEVQLGFSFNNLS